MNDGAPYPRFGICEGYEVKTAFTIFATGRGGRTRIEHFAGPQDQAVYWASFFYSALHWSLRLIDHEGRVVLERPFSDPKA